MVRDKYDALFQQGDPLVGVLDYFTEVCLHGYARLLQVYLVRSKEMSHGNHIHYPRR